MAKFIKRSERGQARQSKTEASLPVGADNAVQTAVEPSAAAEEARKQAEDDAYIQHLIDAYSGESAMVQPDEDKAAQQENLPETDSDVIRYFNNPEEYKYAREKRAAGIRRGRASIFRKSADIDPVPESKPEVAHQINPVRIEHSQPGSEPDVGKYAEETAKTREVDAQTVRQSDLEQTKHAPDGKFIHPTPPEAPQAEDEPPESAEPEKEKPKVVRSGFFNDLLSDDAVPMKYPEYTEKDKEKEVKTFLINEKKRALIKLLVSGSALLLSLIFSLIPLFQSIGDAERTLHLFGGSGLAYGIVMLVLFVVGIAPLLNDFADGFALLLRKKAGLSTTVLLVWLAVLLQNIVLLFFPEQIYTQCSLYNTTALALTLMIYFTRVASITRTTDGFRILLSEDGLCAVSPIADSHRSERIGQGILEPDAKICYRAKMPQMEKYINASLLDDPSVGICTRLLPVFLGVAVLTFVLVAAVRRDLAMAISAFAAVILATAPLSVSFSLKWLLDSFNRRLNPRHGVVPGYASAVSFASADAVVFDSSELYDADSLQVYGAKTFYEYPLYDAILMAAALFIGSESPLSEVFRNVIVNRTELLPKVESLIYEDKQGLSAWVGEQKVLAGTREMMENHNIETPPHALEEKYTRGDPDRKIVYLAVDGKPAAIFVVGYHLKPAIRKELSYLVHHGFTILLRSTDPHISDTLVERQMALADDTIKVINTEAAEYFKLCRKEENQRTGTCIFSTDSTLASLRTMTAAVMLRNALDITTPFAIISSVLGLILVAVLLFVGSAAAVTGFRLFLLQGLWMVIGSFACRILAKK